MDETTPPQVPKPHPIHHLRRGTVWALEALGVAVAGAVILAGVLAFRLSQGPVPVNFLSPYLVQALQGIDPGIDVAIGETVVIWSSTGETLQLRARDVHVRAPGGEERATVPELSVSLSIPALFHGMLAPSRLEVEGLRLRLVRTADGKIQFGNSGPDTAPAGTAPDQNTQPGTPPPEAAAPAPATASENSGPFLSNDAIKALIGLFAGAPDSTQRGSYLRRIEVLNAEVVLDDQKAGHVWQAPEAHLSIVRDRTGTVATATLAVDLNGSHPKLDVHVRYRPGDTALTVETDLSDLDPAAIAAAVDEPVTAPLGALEAPLTGVIRSSIGLDGTMQGVRLTLDAGAGQMFFSRLQLSDSPDGVPIDSAHLDAHFSDALDLITVDRLDINLPTAQLTLSGQATLTAAVPDIHLEAQTALLPVPTLIRYWPEKVAVNAREWVAENLEGGFAENAHFVVDLGPVGPNGTLDAKSVDGEFSVKGASIAFLRPLPDATDLTATAKFTTDTLSFAVESGKVGGLTIDDGKVTITGMNVHDQDLSVEAVAHGPLASAFEILDNPRLGFIKQLGIKAADAGGDMATRLRISMPLENHLTFDQVSLLANANLSSVSIPKIALGLDITDGALSLVVDKKGLLLKGKAKVAGEDADIAWEENFDKAASFQRRIDFRGTLDDAARETAGLSFAPYVTGPIDTEALITQYDSHRTGLEVIADLTPSTVTVSDFGWGKKAGDKGTAVVRATLRDDKLSSIDHMELRAGDLTATGRLYFTKDGKSVEKAMLPKVAFGETDVEANISRNAKGAYVIRVKGPKFNVEPLLNAHDDDENAEPGPPMIVDVALGYARLGKGGGATDVTGHLEREGKHWNVMTIDGMVAPSKPMTVRMSPDSNGRSFNVSATDAGAVLKELDITGNAVGGTLKLAGRYDDSDPHSPFKGKLELRNFHLERAPLLAKVLSVASLTGILNALTGQGIDFSELNANITYVGGTIYTDDLLAHGSAVGFTGKGNVDLRKQTIDLQGTVVPAYSLNSVLGNIPLLGSILTGPEGGGVFAANYRMRGSIEDPDVSVNPLSTLAPGILRNIFNIFDKPVSTTPPPKPPETVPAPTAPTEEKQTP